MQIISAILVYVGIALWGFGVYLATASHLRGLIGRAVVVLWRKKYLLFLSFFGGLTAYGGEVNFLFQQADTVNSLRALLDGIRQAITNGTFSNFTHTARTLWTNNPWPITGYVAVVVVIFAVLLWLVITSQAAIIRIVGRYQQNKPAGLIDGLSIGIDKFWPLVQLNIIGLLLGWSAWVILTGVPAAIFLINHATAWSIVAYVGSILSIVASLAIIFLVQFATAGIVLLDTKVMPSIIDAWRLFRRNLLSSVEMAIAIFTVNATVLFLGVGETVFLINPYTSLVNFLSFFGIILFLYAALSGFSFVAWTLYYLQLTAGKTISKLGQWTNQLVNFANTKRAT